MGRWDIPPLIRILEAMGHQDTVGVIVESPGGSADVAHLLSNLLREYCDSIHVYVGTHAFSAATIFALSADELWMGPSSELGPIDPQVPVDARVLFPSPDPEVFADDPFNWVPARVIKDFLEWAGVIEDELGKKSSAVDLNRLGKLVAPGSLNPWVLGWYERADKVSRLYAMEGLTQHLLLGEPKAEQVATKIVAHLLEHYASHEASIVRKEAQALEIPAKDCPDDVWAHIQKIAEFYQDVLTIQGLSRILQSTDGFHALPLRPQRSCPNCNEAFDADPEYRFCPACGKSLNDLCLHCGGVLRTGWAFCPRCSQAVSATATPVPATGTP
jgi:hypothetical protein